MTKVGKVRVVEVIISATTLQTVRGAHSFTPAWNKGSGYSKQTKQTSGHTPHQLVLAPNVGAWGLILSYIINEIQNYQTKHTADTGLTCKAWRQACPPMRDMIRVVGISTVVGIVGVVEVVGVVRVASPAGPDARLAFPCAI